MEMYCPSLKKKVEATIVDGKYVTSKGGSKRRVLYGEFNGKKCLPKTVKADVFAEYGFSAEESLVGSPSPPSPLDDAPATVPTPAEPSNENFEADEMDYIFIRSKDKQMGNITSISHDDRDYILRHYERMKDLDSDELNKYMIDEFDMDMEEDVEDYGDIYAVLDLYGDDEMYEAEHKESEEAVYIKVKTPKNRIQKGLFYQVGQEDEDGVIPEKIVPIRTMNEHGRKKLVNALDKMDAESAFDKLEDEVAEEYEEKGMSDEEADKIGAAVAYKQGVKKYGKKVMTEAAKKGVSAKSLSKEAETCEICAESYALDDEEYCAECSSKHAEYFQTLNAESYTFSKGAETEQIGGFKSGDMDVMIHLTGLNSTPVGFNEYGEELRQLDEGSQKELMNRMMKRAKQSRSKRGKEEAEQKIKIIKNNDFTFTASYGFSAEEFEAEMDGKKLRAGSRDFDDGSMMVGIGTDDIDVEDPDFMEMMIGEDGEIDYFTMPTGLNHYQRMYKPKPTHYGKMKTQNETNETAGGDFYRIDGDGKYAENFSAEFGKPIEDDEEFTTMQVRIGSPSGSTTSWTTSFDIKCVGDEDNLYYLTSDIEDLVEERVMRWNDANYEGNEMDDWIPMQIVIGSSSGNSGSWYRQFTVTPVGDEDNLSYLTSDIEDLVVDRVKKWNGDEVIYDAESTGLSKPARTAIGLTALGVGIALWKSEWINKLFDRR